MTNLVKIGQLPMAPGLNPLATLKIKMRGLKKIQPLDVASELPNTHQCAFCNCKKQLKRLEDYIVSRGKRFCSEMCCDMHHDRNPIERED